jgi:hypothetical protein
VHLCDGICAEKLNWPLLGSHWILLFCEHNICLNAIGWPSTLTTFWLVIDIT